MHYLRLLTREITAAPEVQIEVVVYLTRKLLTHAAPPGPVEIYNDLCLFGTWQLVRVASLRWPDVQELDDVLLDVTSARRRF